MHKAISFILIIKNPVQFGKAQLSLFAEPCYVPLLQGLPLHIAQGVCGAASGAGIPSDTAGGAVHQVTTSGQKDLMTGRWRQMTTLSTFDSIAARVCRAGVQRFW